MVVVEEGGEEASAASESVLVGLLAVVVGPVEAMRVLGGEEAMQVCGEGAGGSLGRRRKKELATADVQLHGFHAWGGMHASVPETDSSRETHTIQNHQTPHNGPHASHTACCGDGCDADIAVAPVEYGGGVECACHPQNDTRFISQSDSLRLLARAVRLFYARLLAMMDGGWRRERSGEEQLNLRLRQGESWTKGTTLTLPSNLVNGGKRRGLRRIPGIPP